MSKSNDQWWINIHILFITDHLISSFILIIIIHFLNWFRVYNFEPQRHYFQFLIVHLYLSYYTESRSVLTSWKDMLDPKLIFQLWGIIIYHDESTRYKIWVYFWIFFISSLMFLITYSMGNSNIAEYRQHTYALNPPH